MDLTLTDALFDLNYIALNVGGTVVVGGDAIVSESIETTAENVITVQGTPVSFGTIGTIGWYSLQGDDVWQKITFEGKNATVAGVPVNSKVCVKYFAYNDALRQFTVPASIIPSEIHLIMTFPLFSAGAKTFTQSYQVGSLIVDVPRFLLSGNYEMSLTSTGASTSNLSGSALASYKGTDCDDMGQYATVKQVIKGASWTDNLSALAVDGADVQLSTGDTKLLSVFGVYKDGTTTQALNSNLTFSVVGGGSDVVTVDGDGVISVVGIGTATVSIVATDTAGWGDPIECYASVTVS